MPGTEPTTARSDRARGYLHVDLDGLWTVASAYGYPEGGSFERDPLFDLALPRLLDLLDEFAIAATFFVVGRDLELPGKRRAVEAILARGHRLANHSYSHAIGLESLDEGEIEREIARASDAIEAVAGARPVGFRAPGYDAGEKIPRACARAGIRYDGSILPTPWAPLLRFAAGRLLNPDAPPAVRARFGRMYGRSREGLVVGRLFGPTAGRNSDPRDRDDRADAEGEAAPAPVARLRVSVSPRLALPIHASLGIALGARSVVRAIERLARRPEPVVWLLHPMDVADPAEFREGLPPRLGASRALARPLAERLAFLREVLPAFAHATRPGLAEDDFA